MEPGDLYQALNAALQEHEARTREHRQITRRDRFIAAALTGLCANPSYVASETAIAGYAIRRADAVLAALLKEASK